MKKILIIISLFLMTGCTAKYKLDIQGKVINETLELGVSKENIDDIKYFKNIYTNDLKNLYIYNFDESTSILSYKYKYSFENYINSSALSSCFTTYNVINNSEYFLISTGGTFKCLPYQYSDSESYDYDEAEISITTNHKVITNNADKKEGNTYYWYINKDNSDSKTINFKISKDDLISKPYIGVEFIIFVLAILFACGIMTLVIINKNKKNNKI